MAFLVTVLFFLPPSSSIWVLSMLSFSLPGPARPADSFHFVTSWDTQTTLSLSLSQSKLPSSLLNPRIWIAAEAASID